MTQPVCGYPGDRDEALVTYLYDEGGDLLARASFEAHLATCIRCTEDLAALGVVRTQIARWSPPEPKFNVTGASSRHPHTAADASRWWNIPAWAQVAAALLFLGASAAIANLDVRYDASGLSVRTGWSRLPAAASAPSPVSVGTASQASFQQEAPWRADLAALERQLKTEFHGSQPIGAAAGAGRTADSADTLRRVRALIDESEKRQQRELALRVAEMIHDVNAQRQADLLKVDRVLGTVQNNLGIAVMKNRAQMQQMDYLIRTSQRP